MALTAYIAATNRLLQNPVPAANPLYTNADLTTYINEGRQQLAGETECIRAVAGGLFINLQQNYPFSVFTVFTSGNANLQGILSALTIRQMAVSVGGNFKIMTNRPWPWFFRYFIAKGAAIAAGTPTTWSQLGRGSLGTFAVSPVPNGAGIVMDADVACLPIDLVDDTTAEAIPVPFTTAIPYYAAYKAFLSSQRTADATTMFNRYKEYATRAIQENTTTVLPANQPGGVGAQIAASRSTLTAAPAPQGGG